jgi:hypothetical protein
MEIDKTKRKVKRGHSDYRLHEVEASFGSLGNDPATQVMVCNGTCLSRTNSG